MTPELLTGLLTALGIGLLIGVVRERRHPPDSNTAGTRTHALVAILGFVSWEFGLWLFVATVLVIGALVVGGYRISAASDPGQTGEVAVLLTLMLAALAHLKLKRECKAPFFIWRSNHTAPLNGLWFRGVEN
jgi:hypothetical protein